MGKVEQAGRTMRAMLLNSSSLVRNATMVAAGMASAAHAGDLPSGGGIVAGSAIISGDSSTTTITQSTRNAVIDWESFSVAFGNTVDFHLADSTGGTLNRVTGTTPSTIAGQITSNGTVYLINPNGIAITSSGTVQTAGGFVASTLDIADADFMAGRAKFKGDGASKLVSNAGSIRAGHGAYVALLGGAIDNSGTITVPFGKLGLGSGEQIALDLNGGNFMQVGVPTSLVTGANPLITNSGEIVVTGGAVQLKAAVLKDAVRNVINMSGSINADSAVGNGGTISLIGGADTATMAGQVTIGGNLSARATGANGNGGLVETSGAHVDLNGAQVSTLSVMGQAGTWLIDPVDFTIAASGGDMTGAALSAALAGGNVTILSSGGASGADGDITVNDAVNWSANSLALDAYRDINVNAVMGATGTAGFVGTTGDLAQNGTSTGGALNFGHGDSSFVGRLDLASTTSFALNQTAYTIITALGTAGSITGTDLQGINGSLTGNFVLGSDVDASATASWNGNRGFRGLGTDVDGTPLNGGNGFNGQFDGLGHAISNLTINDPALTVNAGLFGFAGDGAISNLGLFNASVTAAGAGNVGALAGFSAASINNVVASGTVQGEHNVGGLVGLANRLILNSASSANVIGNTSVGGLAGWANATFIAAHATGNVTGSGGYVGGLIGTAFGTLRQVYATGSVTGGDYTGGLVGYTTGSIIDAYTSGNVMGHGISTGGLAGLNTGYISNTFATGAVAGRIATGGLVGWNQAYIGDSYASGQVTSPDYFIGGLIGRQNGGVSGSYWDSYSTGQTGSVGSGTDPGVTEVTSDPAQSGAANYAFSSAAYTFSGGMGSWVQMNGLRPMGAWEAAPVRGGVGLITNSHQLQLINASADSLNANYVLTDNIALAETGTIANCTAAANCTAGSYSVMWGSGGFVSIGTNGDSGPLNAGAGFTGRFDGGGHIISNLTIDRPNASFTGLFGIAGAGSSFLNLGVTNANVSGASRVGALAGFSNGSFSNVYSAGRVSGLYNDVGGLLGSGFGTIADSYSTASVSGGTRVGGLAGSFNGQISSSHATGTVSMTGGYGSTNAGGLVGSGGGEITNSYATGAVTSEGSVVGGLVGGFNGNIQGSYASGDVSGDGGLVGGLMGSGGGQITNSHATGNVAGGGGSAGGLAGFHSGAIQGSYASGDVTATSGSAVGGLVGQTTGSVDASYATGAIIGYDSVGGLVGVGGEASITDSHATGATGGYYFVGGLIGQAPGGSISGSWASGAVRGSGIVGGLAGRSSAAITRSYATGNVIGVDSGKSGTAGGLIGENRGSLDETYAAGSVTAENGGQFYTIGGLVGYNGFGASINRSFASGNVSTGGGEAGGLVGQGGYASSITNSYATGDVSADGGYAGGLIGRNRGLIDTTYASGHVSGGYGGYYVGGLIGLNEDLGPINSFYDSQTTDQSFGIGAKHGGVADLFGSVQGLTTAQMMQASSFSGWNMDSTGGQDTIWRIYEGYTRPLLKSFMTGVNVTADGGSATVTYNGSDQSGVFGTTYDATLVSDGSAADAGLILGTLTYDCGGGDGSCTNVGNYSVSANGGLYSVQLGYDLILSGRSSLTINPALLTLTYTANAASSTYGSAVAPVSGAISATGLQGSDTLASLGTASWATTASSGSNAGSYSITGSGLANRNYTITSQQASGNATSYTINPALLTLIYAANAASSTYGSAVVSVSGTASASGLVNGDTLASLGTASWVTTASSSSNAGHYSITGSGLANSNYTITNQQASGNATSYTINPALLTLIYTANAAELLFGQPFPSFSGSTSVSGLVNGDTMQAVLAGTGNWATPATSFSPAGRYAINGSGLTASSNYVLTAIQATENATALTINASDQAITAFQPGLTTGQPGTQPSQPQQSSRAGSTTCSAADIAEANRRGETAVLSETGWACKQQSANQ